MSTATSIAYHPAEMPPSGQLVTLAPGVPSLRLPLPFALAPVNVWVLDEDGGGTLVE